MGKKVKVKRRTRNKEKEKRKKKDEVKKLEEEWKKQKEGVRWDLNPGPTEYRSLVGRGEHWSVVSQYSVAGWYHQRGQNSDSDAPIIHGKLVSTHAVEEISSKLNIEPMQYKID